MNTFTRRNLMSGAAGLAAAAAMPFEFSARAATPPAGKQTAGWYRYKIGSIEVTVATDGVARFKMAEDHVTNIKKDVVNAALAEVFMEKDMMTTPYNPVAINTGSKLAVIATDPKDTLVARPWLPASLLIKAMLASEEFHAAAAVSSRTLPSL